MLNAKHKNKCFHNSVFIALNILNSIELKFKINEWVKYMLVQIKVKIIHLINKNISLEIISYKIFEHKLMLMIALKLN